MKMEGLLRILACIGIVFVTTSEGTAQFTISPSTVKTGDPVVFRCEDSNLQSQSYSFYGVNLYKGTIDDRNKVAYVSVGANAAGQHTVHTEVIHQDYRNIAQIDGNFATSTQNGFLEMTVNAIPCNNSDGTQEQWICLIKSSQDDVQSTQTLSITGDARVVCMSGYTRSGSKCLKYLQESASWSEAKELCGVIGGHLLISNSTEDQAAILTFMGDYYTQLLSTKCIWTDGTDLAEEYTWRWSTTGKTLDYFNWYSAEPNGGYGANCIYMIQTIGYHWADGSCQTICAPVCESKPISVRF